jgi:hypothetical protein
MSDYREAEDQAQRVVYQAMGCPLETSDVVEQCDRLMVRFEGSHEAGLGKFWTAFHDNLQEYPELAPEEKLMLTQWQPWPWDLAEHMFLLQHELLSVASPSSMALTKAGWL